MGNRGTEPRKPDTIETHTNTEARIFHQFLYIHEFIIIRTLHFSSKDTVMQLFPVKSKKELRDTKKILMPDISLINYIHIRKGLFFHCS